MNKLVNLEKYKSYLTIKIRFILINFLILTSLIFVILKNFNEIRYKNISNDKGENFVLDRFTSKIKVIK
jgi:large-conductance mechanosensitive channel